MYIYIINLRKLKSKSNENETLPFVFTHNPPNGNFSPSIKETMDLLSNDSETAHIFRTPKLVPSRRQPPNLKKLLTRASLTTNKGSTVKCTDKRCKTCPNMPIVSALTFHNAGKTFHLKQEFSCTSRNLIYCLTCTGCKKQYIGETGDVLRNRMTLHRQHIRDSRYIVLHVSQHIAKCAKGKNIQFEITPFYKITSDDETLRKSKEKYFIKLFKPELNRN